MTASSALRQEVEGWEVNCPKSPNKRRKNQQQSTKRGGHTVQMSRRKLNAVKAYKTESIAKERRHGEKTREKRGRRGRELEIHDYVFGFDLETDETCADNNSAQDFTHEPLDLQAVPEYRLFSNNFQSALCDIIAACFQE